MSHRNTILLGETGRRLTLIAQGSMWPIAVEVDGETWKRSPTVDDYPSSRESIRVYVLSDEVALRRSE